MTLPSDFVKLIDTYIARGGEQLRGLCEALSSTAPQVSVRYNPLKARPRGAFEASAPVAWWPDAAYLDARPAFTFDPALHQGRYYVQDASSMAIAAVVRHLVASLPAGPAITYLDACAAPGGKTTAALDALPREAVVVANEYDYRRANILAENVAKWGRPGVIVTRGDTSQYGALPAFFDIIAADVPCSGEGMMRKDAVAVEQWSPALVCDCAARQRAIIANLWGALKPGGYLIYSTCTFNRQENEDIIEAIIADYGAEAVDVGMSGYDEIAPGLLTDIPCYRFLPGRVRGEGLFMAVLQKPAGEATLTRKSQDARRRGGSAGKATMPALPAWLAGDYSYRATATGEVYAMPAAMTAAADAVSSAADVVSCGTHFATIKGRDIVPAQALALSADMRRDAFPAVELQRDAALTYLRREVLTLPDGLPRGYVLLTYGGEPLGFVKNIGNRCNNLYPQHWRILSAPKQG
ncbi:MAG: rRNA cytosine-C5-methyltransferase [Muribaculaceae bacterium]